ncbi:MAG: pyruvate ferredoxin oxidoreductase [Deltaproteobacteria bacterium]|nr:pyruvate ferredoxin oxidoreductase [Deltaproteobacteria bacterium]
MRKLLTGNSAISHGVALCRAEVISAYPITPQTTIVEELAEFCADGRLPAKFIRVESEHSALACVAAAAATGARTFTATSSHGLAYMHEMLHWTSGARLPVVMVNANRAIGPPWSIWCEEGDSLSQRDTGWLQFYCQSGQEALDTIIQAYRVAEEVLLPAMVLVDGFFLSHTAEPVEIPDQKAVDRFLPPFRPRYKLDPDEPHAFNIMVGPDLFISFRHGVQKAMEEARKAALRVDREFKARFGRSYGILEKVRAWDADLLLLAMGTAASTAREVVSEYRRRGEKVGLCRLRLFRPFPSRELIRLVRGAKKVAVLDRNHSPGAGGILAQELKAALCGTPAPPRVFEFVAGLGGKDITPETIREVIEHARRRERSDGPIWMGVAP